ncbi:hypothetical protein [Nocardioides lianchengensis]|uniref:Uncharacterized protein n=1 Tax=Nocardioides lianchengensis TaxID=1045774 RepID=A0A1G6ZTX3_9ACTN|nr:hypothetical protein [Nocardioides lianchengensis]NYG12227.1 hypothetical protein [Nocardioides lianchengensis]SDE06118.1 hypothetical protein SAMN05421872_11448 [Nocardioides lianchengensis]
MSLRPRLMLRLLVGLVASVSAGGWTTTASAPSAGPDLDVRVDRIHQVDRVAARVDRISRQHRCSPGGLPADEVPVEAIVIREGATGPRGVRLVSFEVGWSTHLGERPGTLLAVCAG